jgi:hypothetical protein
VGETLLVEEDCEWIDQRWSVRWWRREVFGVVCTERGKEVLCATADETKTTSSWHSSTDSNTSTRNHTMKRQGQFGRVFARLD